MTVSISKREITTKLNRLSRLLLLWHRLALFMELSDKIGKAIRVSSDEVVFVAKIVIVPEPLLILAELVPGNVFDSHELAILLQQICIYLEHRSL